MAKFIALVSYSGPLPAEFASQPGPDPASFGLSAEDDGSRDDPLVGQNIVTCNDYRHDFDALRATPSRIVTGGSGRIVGSGQYAPAMANFAVRLVHGPSWDPARSIREQDGWDEHAAFMDGLADTGFIILGGPVGDGEQTLHAVEAPDENEIRTRLALDPWALAGLLRIGTIEHWALWLDGRPGPQASGSG